MEKGLTSKQAQEKLVSFGKNEITTRQFRTPLSILISQFPTFINGILFFASFFSFIIGDAIDGIFILAILILNAIFGFIQEYRAEKSLEKLKGFVTVLSRVIRDGQELQIKTSDLVPGDVVILSEGDRITADGTLTNCHHIEIDESILTGESIPVMKQDGGEAFSATLVTKGKGYLHVKKTGMNTAFGQIAQMLATIETDKTPLQKRLNSLGKILSLIAIGVSLLLIPIGLFQGKELFPLILLAISIGIAAIPEGLPAVVTIALAIGTNRMAKKQAIVRKLPAVETLGAVQILLVDKTGTLTKNTMRVKDYFVKDKASFPKLLKACVFGNTASLIKKADGDSSAFGWDIVGDRTDGALLLLAQKHADIDSIKQDGRIVDEFVFDPQEKTITTIVEKEKKRYVFVRGAPEAILAKSSLTNSARKKMEERYQQYAKEGLRVIGFATKIVPAPSPVGTGPAARLPDGQSRQEQRHHAVWKRQQLEKNLAFLGFAAIYDPPREGVKQAIEKARLAGIQTIMVTGDNELTALSIGKDIGLIEKDEDVMTGAELTRMSDEELKKVILKTRIFARTKPEDKLRLTTILKDMGYVIGVTGDGVNDALALKKADVGIAMGQSGTDVAKEASDIVLTDDNYSTLIHAVEEGRRIYDNILKSITYLLSGNLAEISLVFLAALIGLPNPLLPTQILWINLVTDGLPALALASDHKDPELLKREPRDPKAPILTIPRMLFIGIVGLSIAQLILIIFSFLLKNNSEAFARTIAFNLLVFFHIMNAFIVRGIKTRPNLFLIFAIVGTLIIQAIITTTPVFQSIFHLEF